MALKKFQKQVWVGLSLLIGVTPVLFEAGKRKKKKSRSEQLQADLSGLWKSSTHQMTLFIGMNPTIELDQKKLKLTITKIDDQALYLQDRYGYSITITKIDDVSIHLYDEAEEKTYRLTKKEDHTTV